MRGTVDQQIDLLRCDDHAPALRRNGTGELHTLLFIIDLQQTVRENRLLSYLLESEGMKALAGVGGGDDDEE